MKIVQTHRTAAQTSAVRDPISAYTVWNQIKIIVVSDSSACLDAVSIRLVLISSNVTKHVYRIKIAIVQKHHAAPKASAQIQ